MDNYVVRLASNTDTNFLLINTALTKSRINIKIKCNEILVADHENRLVGLLILDYLWSHIPFIAIIWVEERFCKMGVGKMLLENLEMRLINESKSILFSSSMETAKEAQNWHQLVGFTERGIIKNINTTNIGEIFYRKDLK